jgi:hypothetical protein
MPAQRSVQNFQIVGGHLAALVIGDELEFQLLAFAQVVDPSALYGADMNEGVFAAVIWGDEAEALLYIKPLNGSRRHKETLS